MKIKLNRLSENTPAKDGTYLAVDNRGFVGVITWKDNKCSYTSFKGAFTTGKEYYKDIQWISEE